MQVDECDNLGRSVADSKLDVGHRDRLGSRASNGSEGLGGSLEAFYFAFGNDDVYLLAELPDSVTAAAAGLSTGASGTVRVSTVVLLAPEAVAAATKKSVKYRAPGA